MAFQVHFFLKRTVGNLSDSEVSRLNSWALGLRVLSLLPLPSQQRCSSSHEHPQLILEVLLMMKQLQSASLVLYLSRCFFLLLIILVS
jgi:zinc finger FYVE domain-containing protein 26